MHGADALIERTLTQVTESSPHLGLFSRAAANAHGMSDEVLAALVRSGRLIRTSRGWYHRADPALEPWDLHRRRAAAHVLRHAGRVAVSHHSALVEHGIPTVGADVSTVHVTYRRSESYRTGRGYRVHRADRSTADLSPEAIAVPVHFAVVQAGLVSGPLATLVAGDYALAHGLASRADLAAAADAYRHGVGIAAVAAILPELNGLAESPAESLARYVVRRLGYPVVPQRWVTAQGRSYRADLAIEGTRLLIEVDGMVKYVRRRRRSLPRRRGRPTSNATTGPCCA